MKMRKTTRFQPSFDGGGTRLVPLERREVPSSLGTGIVHTHSIHKKNAPVADNAVTASAPQAAPEVGSRSLVDTFDVATIRNGTGNKINYSIRFTPTGSFKSFSIQPGYLTAHSVPGNPFVAPGKWTISFDKSFAPGIQEQRYTLWSGSSIVTTPGSGTRYVFLIKGNGIDLYAGA